jgi:F plasmid transfer operon, TraF, protein
MTEQTGVSVIRTQFLAAAVSGGALLFAGVAFAAGPVYQPPGTNLTLGDVTHGQRVQSASSNPAAAAADIARSGGKPVHGTVLSGAAGLEYGNVQNLFDLYDQITGAYVPSDPGTGGGPGQIPGDKPGGIDIGQIWDMLDPDIQAAVNALATELATRAVLLALVAEEGYGKAWLAVDAPFVFSKARLGGAWTFGVNWSGSSKAFGVVQPIDFDPDAARQALENWFNLSPGNRPAQIPLSNQVGLSVDPASNSVRLLLDNDSSILTKATKTTELSLGYSRQAWSNSAGSLYLGAEARLYLMQLSRLSVRFGDITDSEELFNAIRNSDFRTDERLGLDLGALWVGHNYQLGVQITNVNEPKFTFPEVNLAPYKSEAAIRFLQRDQTYVMDRQVKLEASVFTSDRRWSGHLGYDTDAATDPMGDQFQWLTLSAGLTTNNWWIPSARIGYRENLVGTELKYVGIGATLFKIVNIDISSSLDNVLIDGQKLPRGLMTSIGFEITW